MKIMTAALAVLLASGVAAEAQRMRPREASPFYVYGEYDYYTSSGVSLNGGGAGLGYDLNRFLGLQAGGQYSRKSGVDFTNFYGEVKLSWPLMPNFSVYGSLGGAYSEASTTVTLPTLPARTISLSTNATSYRAGVGAEFWLGSHWGLRAGWHRQNSGGVFDDISAGIAYRF